MPRDPGTNWGHYVLAVICVWIASAAAALLYARAERISMTLAIAVLPAILVELAFYLAPGFVAVRKSVESLQPPGLRAALLAASALVPYAMVSIRLGTFRFSEFSLLAGLAAALSFWYVIARKSVAADCLFLVFAGGVFLSGIFVHAYPSPAHHVPLEYLGRLMWIRVGVMSALSIRGLEAGFGFLPTRDEWRIGVEQYLLFVPVGVALSILLDFAKFQPAALVWWKFPLALIGTFLGALWVVALGEEFFFRGFLQQVLARAWSSQIAAVIVASLAFGAVHLPFRGFPNWRFAVVAAVAGAFYGIAFARSRSVRAPMVTHALMVTTWRLFFVG